VVGINIVENYNPDPPKLQYYATPVNVSGELEQVTLVWPKKVHNGKYHLYRRNAEGNWIKLDVVQDNAARIVRPLASTSFGNGTLQVQDGSGNQIYHHFKVVSENFAGMISRAEEILTIHQPGVWRDISSL
jgi:beta-xylosidase